MIGKRIAIYGLGRSGLAVARAAVALGASPAVYDMARPDQMVKQDVLDAARELGIELHLGWTGRFEPSSIEFLVTNPSVDMRSEALRQAAADGIEVVSEVEFAYQTLEARQVFAPIVAITGTNGKSTTTVMTTLALRECGIDAVLCGNIFGSGLPEVPLTEAALHATSGQVLVAEISSFQLEWVSHFRPTVAGITNIAPDHLDRYDSFEQYAQMKLRIFGAQREDDFAVVRAHDPVVFGTVRRKHGRQSGGDHGLPTRARVLTFGAQGEHAEVGEEAIRILDKTIRTDEMHVVGTHNYANAAMAGLLAWATLKCLADQTKEAGQAAGHARRLLAEAAFEARERLASKQTATSARRSSFHDSQFTIPDPIIRALKAFKGIEYRMEFLGERQGVRVINNSMCTNPDAVVKSAQAVKGPNHLLIGGKDKELPWKPVKIYLASGMHRAYLFGEAKELLNEQLGGGFSTYNTLEEAFRAATERARPGEVIMLAPGCASTDQFHDFRDRGNVFKTIAKEWLES